MGRFTPDEKKALLSMFILQRTRIDSVATALRVGVSPVLPRPADVRHDN